MNILQLSCSPRGREAESHRLSTRIIQHLRQGQPAATVTERFVGGAGTIPSIDEDYALSQHGPQDVSREGSAALSAELIGELECADVVVIATPMHNFTVPAALKSWIDHVVRVRWTFDVGAQGKLGLLRDRPVLVAVSSGGKFFGERARQPDFLTPYLSAVLGMIGLRDLTFFTVQGTAFGPDALADSRARAERALQDHFASSSHGPGGQTALPAAR